MNPAKDVLNVMQSNCFKISIQSVMQLIIIIFSADPAYPSGAEFDMTILSSNDETYAKTAIQVHKIYMKRYYG